MSRSSKTLTGSRRSSPRVGGPSGGRSDRCARLSDAQAVVHREEFEWDARELLKDCGLDVLGISPADRAAVEWAGRRVNRVRRAPIIDLTRGYEEYTADHKTTVKSIGAHRRRLQRDLGVVRFEPQSADPHALDLLREWKSAQYRRTDRWDRSVGTVGRPPARGALTEPGRRLCRCHVGAARRGPGIVGLHFGLRTDSTLSYWFPTYDRAAARYSPGLVLLLMIVEAAAASGIRRVALGPGDEEYKRRLMTGELRVADGRFERLSPVALVRRLRKEAAKRRNAQ